MMRAGNYAAVVVPVRTEFGELACQFGHSSKKKTPQVVVAFEVLRGPEAGKVISWIGYFTEATEDWTLEALRVCGFEGADLDSFCDQRPTNEVEIVVDHEVGQDGKTRPKVQWVNAPSRGIKMAEQLRDKELKKFASSFKAKLKTMPPIKTVEAKREAPTAATPADEHVGGFERPDDDVPPPDDDPGSRIPF